MYAHTVQKERVLVGEGERKRRKVLYRRKSVNVYTEKSIQLYTLKNKYFISILPFEVLIFRNKIKKMNKKFFCSISISRPTTIPGCCKSDKNQINEVTDFLVRVEKTIEHHCFNIFRVERTKSCHTTIFLGFK